MLKYLTILLKSAFFQAEIKEGFSQPIQPQLETFLQEWREGNSAGWSESRPDSHNPDLLYFILVSSYVVEWQPLTNVEISVRCSAPLTVFHYSIEVFILLNF